MILNENEQKWSSIISEELHVTDQSKLAWMSKYAANHEIYEGLDAGDGGHGLYATPLNTLGMGNPYFPGEAKPAYVGGADVKTGSGDVPMSTLTMALQVAAMTIGFELVPVVPANGPWAMLSYMDTPYAGGKLGGAAQTTLDGKGDMAANKPIYVKVNAKKADFANPITATIFATDVTVAAEAGRKKLSGTYIGFSRIDGSLILEVERCIDEKESDNIAIADLAGVSGTVKIDDDDNLTATVDTLAFDLVSSPADFVQGFANFAKHEYEKDGTDLGVDRKGITNLDPMSRAENETGIGNTIGARMFTKVVQMGAYEVTGSVTRQQLQDMPLYGIDVVGKVLEAMQNEISQHINNRILDRVFKLGVDNYKNQYAYQGVDLCLNFDKTEKELSAYPAYAKFVGTDGNTVKSHAVAIAEESATMDYVHARQRRISSRVLAAANLIAQVSRRGRGNWVVCNAGIASALQDAAGFVIAPMVNTLTQDGSNSLYFCGSIAGVNVYVDPYMAWDDTRICVGRKAKDAEPGVVFMPYILADTVQTIASGTMAPKLLVNSRFAIVDAGFWPEQSYYTFMVDDAKYIL